MQAMIDQLVDTVEPEILALAALQSRIGEAIEYADRVTFRSSEFQREHAVRAPISIGDLLRILSPNLPETLSQKLPETAKLNYTEKHILEVLGDRELSAKALAKSAHYPHNAHFRSVLSSLRKRGVLIHTGRGYRSAIS